MATLHPNFCWIFFCNGAVPFRNGVVRPLFEDRNVHLRGSDLWESRLQIPNSEPGNFTKSKSGECFDVMGLHQLPQNIFRTRRIGANPEKSDLLNFRGPDWRKFSELCVLLFLLGKTDRMLRKSRFSKPIFGHSAGSTTLDRPHCKRFWFLTYN